MFYAASTYLLSCPLLARHMSDDSRLLALATAVPAHELHQAEVMERSRLLFKASPSQIERLLPVIALFFNVKSMPPVYVR